MGVINNTALIGILQLKTDPNANIPVPTATPNLGISNVLSKVLLKSLLTPELIDL